MPTVKEIKMSRAPGANLQGSKQPVHVANYHCEIDESVPTDFAIALCQGIVGPSLPTGANILPQLGERLLWDDGARISDTGQTSAQFQADHPDGYADFGSTVLSIVGTARADNCHHDIAVTWRGPDENGMGFDRLAILNAIIDTPNLPKISL